jgi:pyruvate dehydrogenase E2 component (dihydrolipoyllysine-residue acetyltransferase)
MASEITVPRLGWNMDEGIFVGWLKADGQTVKAGEPLFNLEGDKATQEIESLEAGILRIPPDGPKDGEKVAVGAIVGYLVRPGETAPFDSPSQGKPVPSPSPLVGEVPPKAAVGGPPHAADTRTTPAEMRNTGAAPAPMTGTMTHATLTSATRKQKQPISPRARRVARELGIDPAAVSGTGKTGRIVERDIRAAALVGASPRSLRTSAAARPYDSPHLPSSPEYQTFAVTSIRKTIAARMIESSQTTAAVTITTSVDATNLVNLRRQFKAVLEAGEAPPIGYTEIIVKLTAIALAKHPMLNSRWSGNQIQVWRNSHIGIAVDTEAGLMVPVIRDVPRLSLRELAACTRELANRARSGKLTASELSGGTFTISNLGQLGVEAFTPLINPPECAILGLGRIQNQVVVQNKQFVERDRMVLSLTFDHRIVDGAPAARFLQTLGSLIENPSPWLLS